MGDRVVRVERVDGGACQHGRRRELDHQVRQSPLHGGRHHERVIAEVVRNERRAHGLSGRARLGIANLLDPLDGLAFLSPQLARLAALAIRERDHRSLPTRCRVLGDHPPARQTKSAACAPTTSSGLRPTLVVITSSPLSCSTAPAPSGAVSKRIASRAPAAREPLRHVRQECRIDTQEQQSRRPASAVLSWTSTERPSWRVHRHRSGVGSSLGLADAARECLRVAKRSTCADLRLACLGADHGGRLAGPRSRLAAGDEFESPERSTAT